MSWLVSSNVVAVIVSLWTKSSVYYAYKGCENALGRADLCLEDNRVEVDERTRAHVS